MKRALGHALVSLSLLLAGCGGGDGGSGSAGTIGTPTPTPSGNTTCTLRARQDWAGAQLREWYLFPETLPASLDPAPYASLDGYIDALTATARAQGKDRYFTYVTSIAAEQAYNSTGRTGGFGIRVKTDAVALRAYISESFEGAPALAAGIDRGAEILAIGQSSGSLRSVSDIMSTSGASGVSDALGPNVAGTMRVLRVRDGTGATRDATLTKAEYDLQPVSSRYGWRVIDDGGRKVGYVNLRTFIYAADTGLRQAFASFRAQGVTDVIVDLR